MPSPLTRKVGASVVVPPGESAHAVGNVNADYNLIDFELQTAALRCVSITGLQRKGNTTIVGLVNSGAEPVRAMLTFTLWLRAELEVTLETDQVQARELGG